MSEQGRRRSSSVGLFLIAMLDWAAERWQSKSKRKQDQVLLFLMWAHTYINNSLTTSEEEKKKNTTTRDSNISVAQLNKWADSIFHLNSKILKTIIFNFIGSVCWELGREVEGYGFKPQCRQNMEGGLVAGDTASSKVPNSYTVGSYRAQRWTGN